MKAFKITEPNSIRQDVSLPIGDYIFEVDVKHHVGTLTIAFKNTSNVWTQFQVPTTAGIWVDGTMAKINLSEPMVEFSLCYSNASVANPVYIHKPVLMTENLFKSKSGSVLDIREEIESVTLSNVLDEATLVDGGLAVTKLTDSNGNVEVGFTTKEGRVSKRFSLIKALGSQPSVMGYLTNENITLTADSNGVVGSFAYAKGIFKVYSGLTQVLTPDVVFSMGTPEGCEVTLSQQGVYLVTSMSSDSAHVDLFAKYKGVTVEQRLTLSKSKAGLGGGSGESAKLLFLKVDAFAFTFDEDGILSPASQTITFDAVLRNMGANPIATFTATSYNLVGTEIGSVTLGGSGTNKRTLNGSQWNLSSFSKIVVTASYDGMWDRTTVIRIKEGSVGKDGKDGKDGTGVAIKPSVANYAALIPLIGSSVDGDARITNDTGHLWVFSGGAWSDAGAFKGDKGDTPYVGANGNWWVGQGSNAIDMGIKAQGIQGIQGVPGMPGGDGMSYLSMGFWDSTINYQRTYLGIPMVKVGTPTVYYVYGLQASESLNKLPTTNFGAGKDWKLIESAEMVFYNRAYVETLQAEVINAIELNADRIVSKVVQTSTDGARTEIDTDGIKIYNELGDMNIRFGLKGGFAVMQYFDNDGVLLYDLGPSGIVNVNIREKKWIRQDLEYLGISFYDAFNDNKNAWQNNGKGEARIYYKYVSKIVADVNLDPDNDGKIFYSDNLESGVVTGGVYGYFRGTNNRMFPSNETGARIYPPRIHEYNPFVIDTSPIYERELFMFSNGEKGSYIYAYWNGFGSQQPELP